MKTLRFLCLCTGLCLIAPWANAFPPAPYYTLYGVVRDQVGQTLRADGAALILLKDGKEIGRTTISTDPAKDDNYELKMRIDQNRSGTGIYSEKAVLAQGVFSLAVDLNGSRYYPIEASGTLSAGAGSERKRLDLNLGIDSDHDGLPDSWEEWQLYQAGYKPDANGKWDLSLIDYNGDFDRDGTPNYLEYLAGTFAGDATETFKMAIKQKLATSVRFEFYAITGKVYSIERSTDGVNWARIPYSRALPVADQTSWTATEAGVVSAYTVPGTGSKNELFRLSVR